MFIYRIYYRQVDRGAWHPKRAGGHTSELLEWTDRAEAEAAFDTLVRDEKAFREEQYKPSDTFPLWPPHQAVEFRLVRVLATVEKEFK